MSMIGKTLAHYEITSQLGKGGMGEVYQAKDRKLGRDVAIKVLPEEFARDADRVARFQREAKLLASLNHPNIAAIHGLEESGGTNFLVLELVPGETLADRLKHGPISVEDSLKLAQQIAEALEAAHEKGVIHRDLKPANIKVTPDGKVKVLDFGLAKAYAGDREEVNLSNSPTLSEGATQQGIILGTAAYMSPEQARGEAVDKKADIWAFGCVLFEMLSGHRMFEMRTVSDTMAAVLMREPEWKRLPPNLHPRIRLLLERCLEKEARNRCGSMGEVRADIQKALSDPGGVYVQPAAPAEPRKRARVGLSWVAAALVLGLIIAGIAVWKMKPAEPRQVTRFHHELPEGQQIADPGAQALAVSPDGQKFVYSTAKGLYIRSVNELTAKLIAGTEEATAYPFFSPDGKWIGYISIAERKLKKISINGGAPVALCVVPNLIGASWGEDNMITFGSVPPPAIMQVSASGGTPVTLIKPKSGFVGLPQILPDGKSVLYTSISPGSQSQSMIIAQSLKSGEARELFAGNGARYLKTGHIIYSVGNNLLAVPFDPDKLETAGGSVPIVEGVFSLGDPQFAFSDSGTLVYIPGTASTSSDSGRTLVWVSRDGKEEPLGAPPNPYRYPTVSPDGTRVAATVFGDNSDIWIWDSVRTTLTRLTFDKASDFQSIWTLDSRKIVFASDRGGSYVLYWKAADGTGAEEKLGSMPDLGLLPWSWSSDGKTLIMLETDVGSKWDIGMLSMDGDHAIKPLIHGDATEINPRISPDGKYIAYSSNESGRMEVYVRPFPDVDKGKWQASTNSGNSPLWSPDGRELYYLGDDNTVMTLAVETKPAFSLGTPKVLFKSTGVGPIPGEGTPWDIHPDGKQFLMIKDPRAAASPSGAGPRQINVVLNWIDELKQRVPGK